MEFAAELQASLREFTASGVVEVRENGGRVAPFSGMSWEVRGNGEKPLLHLWSDQFNLTRRVLAITDRSEERLALAVERFGRAKPDRLEFIRREFERGARELSREEFRDRLTHLLAEQFPDETLESLVSSPDLEHSFSGNYARGLLRRGSTHVAVLAVPGEESSDAAGNSLTFALLISLAPQAVTLHPAAQSREAVNRLSGGSDAESSGSRKELCKPLSVENWPEKERSG